MPSPNRSATTRIVEEARLRLSKAPVAELAAGALRASRALQVDRVEFVVVAVPAGTAGQVEGAIRAAAVRAVQELDR